MVFTCTHTHILLFNVIIKTSQIGNLLLLVVKFSFVDVVTLILPRICIINCFRETIYKNLNDPPNVLQVTVVSSCAVVHCGTVCGKVDTGQSKLGLC